MRERRTAGGSRCRRAIAADPVTRVVRTRSRAPIVIAAAAPGAAADGQRTAELLDRITDGFIALDANWRYTYVSERAAVLLGRRPNELIGRVFQDAFPESVGTPFEQAYGRAMRDQVPETIEDWYAPLDRWFENRIFPTEPGIAILFTETTERKRAEAEMRRLAERLEGLHRLDLAILASLGSREISDVALEHLARLVPSERAVVGRVDLATDASFFVATRGDDPTGGALAREWRASVDFPALVEVMVGGVPVVLDLRSVAGFPRVDVLVAAGLRTMLVAPLCTVDSAAIGFIALTRRSDAGFTDEEIATANEVARQLAIALHTESLREERQIAEVERDRLAAALEQSPDAVMLTDLTGRIDYVNTAFTRISGYRRDEAVGQNPRLLNSGHQSPALYAEMWRTLLAGGVWAGDLVDRRKDGTLYTAAAIISPIRADQGATTGYVGVQRDVTAERKAEAREAGRARERSLVAAALGSMRPHDTPKETAAAICAQVVHLPEVRNATVLRFDLDGGAAPLAIAIDDGRIWELRRHSPERSVEMRRRAGQGPWVEEWRARPDHPYLAEHVALGLRAQAYAPIMSGGDLIGVLNVASADPEALTLLTERLPALLEFASLAGALLAPALSLHAAAANARAGVKRVIEAGAFHPVFQPIVHLDSDRIVGYEALTRFDDGVRPDHHFDEAATVGLGVELELATLAAAVEGSAGLPPGVWLNLNVSPALLLQSARLRRALQPARGSESRRVMLEITEHDPITDYRALRRSLARLGPSVDLAVDDAGAGFASFRHILELRPRYVKLDYGLVHRIDRDSARQALIVGMVHFAGQVACQLIAEGVETAGERRTLQTLGVGLGQGFLLGRPAPITAQPAAEPDPQQPAEPDTSTRHGRPSGGAHG